MPKNFETAVIELHQVAPEAFVGERKRLAAALKADGQKEDAQRLLKLQRPTVSVWLVNQLYTRERGRFDQLFAGGEALRHGEQSRASAHRETLAGLRECALALLAEAGRPAQDAVIRRVMTTLSTLAANGSFDPDLPGALRSDRDAVGFGVAMTFPEKSEPAPQAPPDVVAAEPPRVPDEAEREAEFVREAELERERQRERVRAQHTAELARLKEALNVSQAEVKAREAEVERQRKALDRAEKALTDARRTASAAAAELEAFSATEND